jgi:NADH dehydrogenase
MTTFPGSAEETGQRHRVVVIGSGFGGLTATKALKNAPVDLR